MRRLRLCGLEGGGVLASGWAAEEWYFTLTGVSANEIETERLFGGHRDDWNRLDALAERGVIDADLALSQSAEIGLLANRRREAANHSDGKVAAASASSADIAPSIRRWSRAPAGPPAVISPDSTAAKSERSTAAASCRSCGDMAPVSVTQRYLASTARCAPLKHVAGSCLFMADLFTTATHPICSPPRSAPWAAAVIPDSGPSEGEGSTANDPQ